MKYIVAPSILAANFNCLESDLEKTLSNGAEYVHIDVMDGHFVPQISFGMPVIKSIRSATEQFFDVHLMVEYPEKYIEMIADCGADGITVHAESTPHLHRVIGQIKACGKKAGVAINPATPLSSIEYVMKEVDMVLIMTVNPGFGGQSFIPEMLSKVQKLRKISDEMKLNLDIEVDGGIKRNNLLEVANAGANIFVAGSSIFDGDIENNTKKIITICQKLGLENIV